MQGYSFVPLSHCEAHVQPESCPLGCRLLPSGQLWSPPLNNQKVQGGNRLSQHPMKTFIQKQLLSRNSHWYSSVNTVTLTLSCVKQQLGKQCYPGEKQLPIPEDSKSLLEGVFWEVPRTPLTCPFNLAFGATPMWVSKTANKLCDFKKIYENQLKPFNYQSNKLAAA